jgi:hypothetical protein
MNKIVLRIGLVMFSIQSILFLAYITSRYVSAEMPLVIWDEYAYYVDAKNVFLHFGWDALKSMQNSTRPVFAWFSIFLMKILSLGLNYQLLSLMNTVFYHSVLGISIYYILQATNCHLLTIIAAVSTLYSMPSFFKLSTTLLGDVPTASWVVLFSACLVAIQKPSKTFLKAFILGIVAALGFQTKPIFILYFILTTACFTLTNFNFINCFDNKKYQHIIYKILPPLGIFIISFCSLLYFVYPLNLNKLIAELSYNNETLAYWVSAQGIFNSYLWFINVVFNEIAIIPALILSLSFLGGPINFMKNLPSLMNQQNFVKNILGKLQQTTQHKILFIWLSFITITLYVSFFVKSKDARASFLLFPIFIILSFYAIDWISRLSKFNQKIYTFLILSILLFNLANTASWSAKISSWLPLNLFNTYLNLEKFQFYTNTAVVINIDTYQNLGVEDVLKAIEKDCQPSCLTKPASVLIPHGSSRYNLNGFLSFSTVNQNIYPDHQNKNEIFNFTTALFNLGGWGLDGGIPKSFFTANYIILVKNNLVLGGLAGNTEVYNKALATELSATNQEFIDGLVAIHETRNRVGDTIIVYKREKLPSADNFVKIVQKLSLIDPNNLWNTPFIYAALQINPQLPELQQQFAKMSEVIKSAKYHYGTAEQEAMIQSLITEPNAIEKHQNIRYPLFLTK